ncbi:hypothetical protein AOLI_G00137140 [Acnodon oligacanthus]
MSATQPQVVDGPSLSLDYTFGPFVTRWEPLNDIIRTLSSLYLDSEEEEDDISEGNDLNIPASPPELFLHDQHSQTSPVIGAEWEQRLAALEEKMHILYDLDSRLGDLEQRYQDLTKKKQALDERMCYELERETKRIMEVMELKLKDLGQSVVDRLKCRDKKIDSLLSTIIPARHASPSTVPVHHSTPTAFAWIGIQLELVFLNQSQGLDRGYGGRDEDMDPITFVEKCEEFLAVHPLSETEVFSVLTSALEGTAKDWWLQHRINTIDHIHIRKKAYRVSLEKQKFIKQEINDMLEKNIMRPSISPWASPVLVPKKDSGICFCVDYCGLNAKTHLDAYPMPQIQGILESLHAARIFSTLDLRSGYWQVGLEESSVPKTAFVTLYMNGYMNLPVFLLDFKNFQHLMENVLQDLRWVLLFYIDDIVIYSPDVEHLSHLSAVFLRIQQAGFTLNLKKCNLMQQSFTFLGHVISEKGIQMSTDKIQAIQDYPEPKNMRHSVVSRHDRKCHGKRLAQASWQTQRFRKLIKTKKNTSNRIHYVLQNGFLFWRLPEKADGPKDQLMILSSLCPATLEYAHDNPLSGNLGKMKTLMRMLNIAYWPTIRKDVWDYCQQCQVCQKYKPRISKLSGLLQSTAPVESGYTWGLDFMGPFPRSHRQNEYLPLWSITIASGLNCFHSGQLGHHRLCPF